MDELELQNLRATIGQHIGRVFCPPASIFPSHIEADSFAIWLNNTADFVSIYAENVPDEGWLKVSRSNKPLYFPHDSETNCVSECSDIHLQGDFWVKHVEVFGEEKDYGLIFRSTAGDAFCILINYNDLCCYRTVPEWLAAKSPCVILE